MSPQNLFIKARAIESLHISLVVLLIVTVIMAIFSGKADSLHFLGKFGLWVLVGFPLFWLAATLINTFLPRIPYPGKNWWCWCCHVEVPKFRGQWVAYCHVCGNRMKGHVHF